MALLPDLLDAGVLELCRTEPKFHKGVLEAYEASYAEVHRWLVWAQEDPTPDDLWSHLQEDHLRFEKNDGWRYVMLERMSGLVVGWASLRPTESSDVVSIGYWVRTDRTRLGYATAATRCLTNAAFHHLAEVDRVEISMDRSNVASVAVPRKLAYRLDRETEYEPLTPAHTGRGFVWTIDRASWTNANCLDERAARI